MNITQEKKQSRPNPDRDCPEMSRRTKDDIKEKERFQ